MKKAYITDLDHTFLRNDLTLSSFTKEQLQLLEHIKKPHSF